MISIISDFFSPSFLQNQKKSVSLMNVLLPRKNVLTTEKKKSNWVRFHMSTWEGHSETPLHILNLFHFILVWNWSNISQYLIHCMSKQKISQQNIFSIPKYNYSNWYYRNDTHCYQEDLKKLVLFMLLEVYIYSYIILLKFIVIVWINKYILLN